MQTVQQHEIDAANAYETMMVPALFGEWAPRVADAAGLGPGDRVLDVGCGTGVLSREAASRVGRDGSVVGLDAGAGMLAVAKRLEHDVEWRSGVAESLPFADRSFDAVVSQFGLMFFDRDPAVREMVRVLQPGGRLAVAVWDSLDNIPAYAAEVALVEQMAGAAAADALRAPFVLGDRSRLASLFADAGATDVDATTLKGQARFPSVRVVVEADLRGWLPLVGIELPERTVTSILEAADEAMAPFVQTNGTAGFETSVHIVTATAP